MKQKGKDKIITRAIHFIATNTKDESYRIGQAIIAELELVKKLTIPVVSSNEVEDCVHSKYHMEVMPVIICTNCNDLLGKQSDC